MSDNPPKWEPPSDPFNLTGKYILVHRKPVACPDLFKWGKWLNRPYNKRVRSTYVGDTWISTVFLGLDHDFRIKEHKAKHKSKPILFETMVFFKEPEKHEYNQDDDIDTVYHNDMTRCCTWRRALALHWDMVRRVKDEQ